ncbi:MAG: GNAT family N-acetyltransferase [Prevotella sp.]
MIESIETERLILREWRYSDLLPFAEMNSDTEVMKYFPNTLSKEFSDNFAHRIIAEMNTKGYGLFAVQLRSTGKFIGYVGLHEIGFDSEIKGETEIGWRLDKRYWNNGYATEAANAVLNFAKTVGLKKLYSFTAVVNAPSERVMNKIGMEKVGEFEHPTLDEGHWLRRNVLYSIEL